MKIKYFLKKIIYAIKKSIACFKSIKENDPVYSCEVFKKDGCAFCDSPWCDFPDCEILKTYRRTKKINYKKLTDC